MLSWISSRIFNRRPSLPSDVHQSLALSAAPLYHDSINSSFRILTSRASVAPRRQINPQTIVRRLTIFTIRSQVHGESFLNDHVQICDIAKGEGQVSQHKTHRRVVVRRLILITTPIPVFRITVGQWRYMALWALSLLALLFSLIRIYK